MSHKLQWKLILIFILFIFAIIMVSGTFIVTSVSSFYLNQFKIQMDEEFSGQLAENLSESLSDAEPAAKLSEVMDAYAMSRLGIGNNRNYYILDGKTGLYINGSGQESQLNGVTDNIISAINGKVGNEISLYSDYMDYAYPVLQNEETEYIIYVADNKNEISAVLYNIFRIILQAFLYSALLAIIFGFFMSRTITVPIRNLTTKAGKIAEGDFLDANIRVQGNDEIGTLTQTFNTMADKLKKTMREMEGEKSKIEIIIRNLEDGIIAFDSKGVATHTNPAAIKLLKLPKKSTYRFDDIFPPLGIPLTSKDVQDIKADFKREYQIETDSAALILHFAPFRTEGQKKSGIIAAISDITKQQKLENSRKAFVANVSHELRTPLTNIKSYAETMLDSDLDPETTESFLQVINSEADRMTRLVRDLLVLSQLDHANTGLKPVELDISELVSDTVNTMRIEAKNRQLTLTYVPGSSTETIMADPDRIRQVIVNILSNAIKYTPAHGSVTVLCGQQKNNVYVQISDTGIGIPEKDLPMLFERFYRVDKARSREMGGTGLGLAIAKEMVEAHNGSIALDSEYGKGTTVTIYLPRKGEEKE